MSELVLLGRIGDQAVALDATRVESVARIDSIVAVPFAPPHIRGIAAIRSQTLTVIDASIAVGGAPLPTDGRAAICTIDGHRYAIRFDTIDDVVAHEVEPISGESGTGWTRVATGRIDLGDRFALALDPAALVSNPH